MPKQSEPFGEGTELPSLPAPVPTMQVSDDVCTVMVGDVAIATVTVSVEPLHLIASSVGGHRVFVRLNDSRGAVGAIAYNVQPS